MLTYKFSNPEDEGKFDIVKFFHPDVVTQHRYDKGYTEFLELLHSKDKLGTYKEGYFWAYVDILDESNRVISETVAVIKRKGE